MGKIDELTDFILKNLKENSYLQFKEDNIGDINNIFIHFTQQPLMRFIVNTDFFHDRIQSRIIKNCEKELYNFAKFIKYEFNIITELNSCYLEFAGYSPRIQFKDVK